MKRAGSLPQRWRSFGGDCRAIARLSSDFAALYLLCRIKAVTGIPDREPHTLPGPIVVLGEARPRSLPVQGGGRGGRPGRSAAQGALGVGVRAQACLPARATGPRRGEGQGSTVGIDLRQRGRGCRLGPCAVCHAMVRATCRLATLCPRRCVPYMLNSDLIFRVAANARLVPIGALTRCSNLHRSGQAVLCLWISCWRWQNPYVEHLIGTLRRDCLDDILIVGERHSRRVLALYSLYQLQ
jgi:hypothetical protein